VGLDVLGLGVLDDRTEVEETGTTFEANARLKAEGYSLRTVLPVLAEDSGLEVDALDGEPGTFSARYGGPGLDDPGRCALVLRNLAPIDDPARRTARFHCVMALARRGRTLATFDGTVEGTIAPAPRGSTGFGYDPIFLPRGHVRTFAEMSREEKQALSHRGRALAALTHAIRAGRLAAALNGGS